MTNDLYKLLNAPQLEAVQNYEGPTLIIAGAGSGKTRTLTCRIANMIEHGVAPWNIMALTFTNKAAREMKERIESSMPREQIRGLWMGTFHGIFRRILGQYSDKLGFQSDYTIYDSSDAANLIKQIVKEMDLSDEFYKPKLVASRISLAKNNLMLPEVYATRESLLEEDRNMKCPKLYQVYAAYCKRCKANGAMDFDDLLLNMNILLRDYPEVVDELSQRFKYILVDEYQDTNAAQYMILRKLSQGHGNICVVGDDSQSIYSFRGAKIENILRFNKDYPQARIIKLEQNYRSTSNIVKAANSLIEHNTKKLPKKLFSDGEAGEKIGVMCCPSDRFESEAVCRSIVSRLRSGAKESDFAILYRINAQSRVFEDSLRHRNIPYRIYGGHSFYQREEVKDLLGYIKLAVNPSDDIAFRRVINKPTRGIGATSIERIALFAREREISLFEAIKSVDLAQMGVKGAAVTGISKFLAIFQNIDVSSENGAYEIAIEIANKSGIMHNLQLSGLPEDASRMQNIEELLNSIKEFVENDGEIALDEEGNELEQAPKTISEWLGQVSLLTDADEKDDNTPRVTLLTVHASKGLEFKYTYIVGLEEQLFPSNRAGSVEELEEERRIFYVAMTRAESAVTLSYAQSRFKFGETVDCTPSRFFADIDVQFLEGDVDEALGRGFERSLNESLDGERDEKPKFEPYKPNYKRVEKPHIKDVVAKLEEVRSRIAANRGGGVGATNGNYGGSSASGGGASSVGGSRGVPGGANIRPIGASSSKSAVGNFEKVESSGDLSVGKRVEHVRFGFGEVVELEQSGNDVKISVRFEDGQVRKLLKSFAKLRILG